MKTLQVRLAKKVDGVQPELRFYDGALGFVTYDAEGVAEETLVGINSMIDGLIFDSYEVDGQDYTVHALTRDLEVVDLTFTPGPGHMRGLKHVFEEVRKGKESVVVRGLDRKPFQAYACRR